MSAGAPGLALALLVLFTGVVLTGAAGVAAATLRGFERGGGSPRQLELERRWVLAGTAVWWACVLRLPATLLFVEIADGLSDGLAGAMCAVGPLTASPYGAPALVADLALGLGAAVWLLVDAADRAAEDTPWTRYKSIGLLALAPLGLLAGGLQLAFLFTGAPPEVVDCCASVFTPEAPGARGLSGASPRVLLMAAGASGSMAVVLAVLARRTSRRRRVLSVAAAAAAIAFAVAIGAGIIEVVAPYLYESPLHHCPFCMLKPGHGRVGYALWLPLWVGLAGAGGALALALAPRAASLAARRESWVRRLLAAGVGGALVSAVIGAAIVARSGLRLPVF